MLILNRQKNDTKGPYDTLVAKKIKITTFNLHPSTHSFAPFPFPEMIMQYSTKGGGKVF